jgi:hypothetical protein
MHTLVNHACGRIVAGRAGIPAVSERQLKPVPASVHGCSISLLVPRIRQSYETKSSVKDMDA